MPSGRELHVNEYVPAAQEIMRRHGLWNTTLTQLTLEHNASVRIRYRGTVISAYVCGRSGNIKSTNVSRRDAEARVGDYRLVIFRGKLHLQVLLEQVTIIRDAEFYADLAELAAEPVRVVYGWFTLQTWE